MQWSAKPNTDHSILGILKYNGNYTLEWEQNIPEGLLRKIVLMYEFQIRIDENETVTNSAGCTFPSMAMPIQQFQYCKFSQRICV